MTTLPVLFLALVAAPSAVVIDAPTVVLRSESLAYCSGESEPALDSVLLQESIGTQYAEDAGTGMEGGCGAADALASVGYQATSSDVQTQIDIAAHVANALDETDDNAGMARTTSRVSFDLVLDDTRDVVVSGAVASFRYGSEGASCYLEVQGVVEVLDDGALAGEARLTPGTYAVWLDCSGVVSTRQVDGALVGGGFNWATATVGIELTRVGQVPAGSTSFGTLKTRF